MRPPPSAVATRCRPGVPPGERAPRPFEAVEEAGRAQAVPAGQGRRGRWPRPHQPHGPGPRRRLAPKLHLAPKCQRLGPRPSGGRRRPGGRPRRFETAQGDGATHSIVGRDGRRRARRARTSRRTSKESRSKKVPGQPRRARGPKAPARGPVARATALAGVLRPSSLFRALKPGPRPCRRGRRGPGLDGPSSTRSAAVPSASLRPGTRHRPVWCGHGQDGRRRREAQATHLGGHPTQPDPRGGGRVVRGVGAHRRVSRRQPVVAASPAVGGSGAAEPAPTGATASWPNRRTP